MNITDFMSRTCLAMVAGLVLVSVSVGDDIGQGRGDQPLRFAGPLAVHPRNPRYFVDGSGKAIYLGGHQVFTEIQDNAWANYGQDPPANEEGRAAIMDMDHINPSRSAATRSIQESRYSRRTRVNAAMASAVLPWFASAAAARNSSSPTVSTL